MKKSDGIAVGVRVEVIAGFYIGHHGEVVARINGRWRVKLDQADKLAFVNHEDMIPEE